MSITRTDAITAIGTTTPTAILPCLVRPLETETEREDDKLLEVVTDGDKDEEDANGSARSAGEVIEDPEGPVETLDDWRVDESAGEHPLSPTDDMKEIRAVDC